MVRWLVIGGAVVVAFTVFSVIDMLMTDRRRFRALNKPIWALLILLLPVVGGALWLVLGKARRGPNRPAQRIAPDDDPAFLRGLARDKDQDERIRKLEQELSELDDDPPKE